jgi:lipopolysaccharide export system permease protein
VNDSGLWIKDEINDKVLIIKANHIEDNDLIDVLINEFDSKFNLIRTIQSDLINIKEKNWTITNALITKNNLSTQDSEILEIRTNFDREKISSLFSNISTLNIFELFTLKDDFQKLGYSTDEIKIHLLKIFSTPLVYGVLTVLASIIMFNFKRDQSLFFHIILGILMSVIIYYMNFMFSSLGNNGKIPIIASIFLPILFITIIAIIGLIRINEK